MIKKSRIKDTTDNKFYETSKDNPRLFDDITMYFIDYQFTNIGIHVACVYGNYSYRFQKIHIHDKLHRIEKMFKLLQNLKK